MLTYGSVCSGIEAATVAWHPLGMRPAWFCEIEPFPSAVLAHHYPEVPNYGDFTALLSKDHPRADVDVLVGGTPCQAFSVAGLRGGLSDPRGNLALAFVALVGALRPRWVVWENVPGVLSVDGGRAFGSFLGGLEELGYGWAYRTLDAQYSGLAQRRKRVFVVASPGDWRRAASVLFEPACLLGDPPSRGEAGAAVAGSLGTGASNGGGWRVGADEAAGHAIPVDLQNTRIGGDVVGTLDTTRPGRGGGQAVMAYNVHGGNANAKDRHAYETEVARCVDSFGGFAPNQGGTVVHAFGGNNTRGSIDVATAVRAKGGTGHGDFESETFVAHTLRGTGHEPQTFAWQVTGTSRTDIHDVPGRARAVTTAGLALREARGVRRLMPHELERLQGFPDGYTLIPGLSRKAVEDDYAAWFAARYPDATRAEIERFAKDGPRAKALGNSMAVPCMRWIGQRILMVDAGGLS